MGAERKRGYQQLADLMSWDSSLAILPHFASANMVCLLHKQAEILELEECLEDLGYANNSPQMRTQDACVPIGRS